MEINLNDPQDFTIENVARLIGSKDDSVNRQLRVTTDGFAFLSDDFGNINTDGLAFRFETLHHGNGYCGKEASRDSKLVKDIYQMLKENWPNPKCTYIDH